MYDALIGSVYLVGSAVKSVANGSPAVMKTLYNGTTYYGSAAASSIHNGAVNAGDLTIRGIVTSKSFKIGAGVAVGAVGGLTAVPLAVNALGFAASGIKAGSIAASMMSTLGGAATQSGSVVAVCQSIGATGSALGSLSATSGGIATGSAIGAYISNKISR